MCHEDVFEVLITPEVTKKPTPKQYCPGTTVLQCKSSLSFLINCQIIIESYFRCHAMLIYSRNNLQESAFMFNQYKKRY